MTLTRIDLIKGKSVEYRATIVDIVHAAMVNHFLVPKGSGFYVISELSAANLVFDPYSFGVERSRDCILIQVTLVTGRTLDQKRGFYRQIADKLYTQLGVRREDVVVSLVAVESEDWSFGNGEASLMKPAWCSQ
jgi:phenylpyruvate tautomerase PptA (4-oxalocrotonate tautomerase family)